MIKSDLEDIMTTVINIINQAPCMPSDIKSKGGVDINTSEPRARSLSIAGINNVRKTQEYVNGCYTGAWQFRLSYTSMCQSNEEKIKSQSLLGYFTDWFQGMPAHDEFGNLIDDYLERYPEMSDERELIYIRDLRNPYVQEITKSGLTVISTEYMATFLAKNHYLWRQNA